MRRLSIFTKCAYKKLTWVYFLLILSAFFGGTGTVVAQSKLTLTINNLAAGNLQTEIEALLGSASLSEIETLIISGNTLNIDDINYLQATTTIELQQNLKRLELSGFSAIPDNAFKGFTGLSSVSLASVVSLGESVFEGCNSLSMLDDVSDLRIIGNKTFYNCTLLSVPGNTLRFVNKIGDEAFYGCTSIAYVDLTGITSLGVSAFENCTSLDYVDFPNSRPTLLGTNAFKANAMDLTASSLPNWVRDILTGGSNNVFLNQRPTVNLSLSPMSKTVLLNANFNLIEPTIQKLTRTGKNYKDIIESGYGWLDASLEEPEERRYYLGMRREPAWLQDNIMNEIGLYPLTYYIFQGDISIGSPVTFNLTVSGFVTCDGETNRATTSKLIITLPENRSNLSASQIIISSALGSNGSATVGTPVKTGSSANSSTWEVPLTNVVAGNILVKILTGNSPGNYGFPGGGEQATTLYKGCTLWFNLQNGNMPETETTNLVFENGKWGKLVTYYNYTTPPSTVGQLPVPTRRGYNFIGWFSEPDNKYSVEYASTTQYQYTTDITVYAVWEPKSDYIIYFDPNEGELSKADSSKMVTYNARIGTLPVPTRAGYTFTVWTTSLDESLAEIYTENTIYQIDGDTTLYALWEANYYLLKFNMNDETDTYLESKRVKYDSLIGDLPVPQRPGYRFTVWNIKQDGEGETFNGNMTYQFPKDTTLYAQWEVRDDYKINFDPNGGILARADSSKTVTYDAAIGTMPVPTLTGYRFTEWNTKQDGLGDTYTEATIYKIDGDTILFAQWEARDDYKINFDPTGGELARADSSKLVTYNAAIGTMPVPTLTGYTFIKWNTLINGGETYTEETIYQIDGDTTLYAVWEARNDYKINFDPNGGELAKEDSVKMVTYDAAIGEMPVPTLAGHKFIEWNTLQDGTGETYTEETVYQIDGDTTLYAQWEVRDDFKINFDPNGGILAKADSSKIVTYNVEIGELPVPAHTGYTFIRWSTLVNGGETYTEETIYKIDGDTTLFAQWEARSDYKINFDPNGGELAKADSSKTVTYNAAIGELPVPVLTGYTFVKWNTLINGGETYTEATIYKIDGDTTLFAVWKANNYTITFNPNEGTVTPLNKTVTYNAEIGELPDPTRNGYAFTEWNTLQSGEGDAYIAETLYQWTTDTTLYAQWRKLSENTTISGIKVNGKTNKDDDDDGNIDNDISLCFQLECDGSSNSAIITVDTVDDMATIIYNGQEIAGNSFEITFEKYGLIPVTVTIKAEAGNTKDSSFCIARRFQFDDVIITRWDNTMTVINNPLNNGGFHFNSYEWYEATNKITPVSSQQFYSVGKDGRLLDPNREYYVILTADEYKGELATCIGKPVLKKQPMTVYPNPIQVNMALIIEIDEDMPDANIELYNVSGALLKREKATGRINKLYMPYPAGIYLVKVNGQTTTIIVE